MRYPTGEESKRGECVGDCRAETWGRGHSLSPCSKVGQGWENTKRSLFNKLDRFLPRLPVAKAWQRYSKRHGRYKTVGMVTARRTAWPLLGGCSALLSGLSPRGVPSQAADLHNVHDTLCQCVEVCGANGRACWATACSLSAYSVSGQQAEPSGARRAATPAHGECIVSASPELAI